VLELEDLSLQVGKESDPQMLLGEVGARFPKQHFAAILGPSGCGKSTLLKVIAGLREATLGQISWDGRDLADEDMDPHEIGYVPQFSIAYELLTVWESIEAALRLRVQGLSAEERDTRLEQILRDVGLEEIEDRRVQLLSGGQRRRLALALELVSSPHLLLCDEVTSGLDPKAEDEIVKLMHSLSRAEGRIVLSVTHSLRHLALYDSVVVLYRGHVAYHGAADTLLHYFGVEHPEELFPRLAARHPEDWHRSWQKYRPIYYQAAKLTAEQVIEAELASVSAGDRSHETHAEPAATEPGVSPEEEPQDRHGAAAPLPSALAQFSVLLGRRWRLFFRDRGQLLLQLALLFGFPCLVVIFALEGLPQLKSFSDAAGSNFLQQMQQEFAQRAEFIQAGSLVSGLVMFQVILLALMGSNNAAREIAGERLIFEKEKFAGLRPLAYVASKAAFLGTLVVVQSVWMGVFVNLIVRFPGDLGTQVLLLILVNAALTAICLGLSAIMKTAEQASLVSVYLVGFQLPTERRRPRTALSSGCRHASVHRLLLGLERLHPDDARRALLRSRPARHPDAPQPVPLCIWTLVAHVISASSSPTPRARAHAGSRSLGRDR
jgi:ABC-type multidrug transport system ATPase subunit